MPVTFTRAATVQPGEAITSTQLAKLADAFNDRLRSGLGDGAWRLRYYWLSLFRQVRGPDASGNLWPSEAEFFERFQGLEATEGHWPVEPYANPEGANLASQMMAFVFGNPWVEREDNRLADQASGGIPIALGVHTPVNDAELWELAKAQRGGYDPDNDAIGSPAISAAQSYGGISYSAYSPHGNSYGDFIAGPAIKSPVCQDPLPSDISVPPVNYDIFFTKLDPSLACPPDTFEDGDACHYAGTCLIGPGTDEGIYDKHIAGITETPWSYFVFLNDGTIHELPRSQWIIGPFAGNAVLRKQANNALARMLNTFVSEFRGTSQQRVEESWNAKAFDFQRFLTSQYQLSPALGYLNGDFVDVVYPSTEFTGSVTIPAGTEGPDHDYRPGFVCTGAVAMAKGLASACMVEVLSGETVIASLALTPDEMGEASTLVILQEPAFPTPLTFRLPADTHFLSAAGKIVCEATELAEYKPQLQDLYALLRLSGVSFSKEVDGAGVDEESAALFGENYWKLGCIINVNNHVAMPGSPDAVNTNAVFDAARRLSRMVRIIPRENFIGYEVVDGKSVCYFNRRGFTGIDLFDGIGPRKDAVPSGEIVPNVVYVVRDASIAYATVVIGIGEQFTGVEGVTEYTGEGQPFEVDGIIHNARPQGFTNEWLMGCEFKSYHLGEASLWKPEAYADHWALTNRCLFFSPEVANDDTLLWHFAFGQAAGVDGNMIAEAPTGYNYTTLPEGSFAGYLNANTVPCDGDPTCEAYRRNFYKSCRIYEREPEIESATVLKEGQDEVVKLVFKTRFHHAPSAPASVSRDYTSWSAEALHAEEFRSMENALRQYLLHAYWGGNCSPGGIVPMGGVPTGQPGNAAMRSEVQGMPDNPFGSCYPSFGFTQLIPKPYIDENDTQDTHDTPLYHDTLKHAEVVLRAICEGYVDGPTTTANLCDFAATNLFAYTYENLLHQASAGQVAWLVNQPTTTTPETTAKDTRPDRPEGFGPLPNTRCVSEVFNLYANAVNLLTDLRVMLPMQLQCREEDGENITWYSVAYNANGEAVPPADDSYSGGSSYAVWVETTPPVPPTDTIGEWANCPSGALQAFSGVAGQQIWDEANQRFGIPIHNHEISWRWTALDPDALYAIPEEWRDMIEANAVLIAKRFKRTHWFTRQQLPEFDAGYPCNNFDSPDSIWNNSGGSLYFNEETDDADTCEILATSGHIKPPPLHRSTWSIAKGNGVAPCGNAQAGGSDGFEPINLTDLLIRVPLV